jgi:hypothetical protein
MKMRWALLMLLAAPLTAGCGTAKSVKESLTPKASVLGVSIVGVTPEHVLVRVDVKTDDVDLMLGMVKVKYKLSLLDSSQVQKNDDIPRADLMDLKDSGFSFLVKVPHSKVQTETKLGYRIQGSIVLKVIAKIADVGFAHEGELPLNP